VQNFRLRRNALGQAKRKCSDRRKVCSCLKAKTAFNMYFISRKERKIYKVVYAVDVKADSCVDNGYIFINNQ